MEHTARNHGGMKRPIKARTPAKRRRRPPRPHFIGPWLIALGAKAADVVRGAKVNEGYLSQLISGQKDNPSDGFLLDVATYLGVTVENLREPPPSPEAIAQTSKLSPDVIARLRVRRH